MGTDLKELEERANQLAVDLGKNEIAPCRNGKKSPSCIHVEETRPLTRAEKKQGWGRRPFYGYEPRNMCDACAAYWHASMVRICLLDLIRRDEIAAGDARPLVEDRKVAP